MQRVDETSALPFGLVAAIQSRHRGLRHLELQQLKGASSYQTIPGHRYSLTRGESPPEHDETPDDSVADIAAEVWNAARSQHNAHGGDQRFRVRMFVAKKDGSISTHDAKFGLDDGDDEDGGGNTSADLIDARTRRDVLSSVLHEQLEYIKALHANQKSHDESRRSRADELDAIFKTFAGGVGQVFDSIANVIPRILDLRLDAMEDHIESLVEGAGMERRKTEGESEQWKGAIESVKELFAGPVGQAGVAKLMGYSPEEAAALISKSQAAAPPANAPAGDGPPDIRHTLRRLGMSLSAEQQAQLKQAFGESFAANLLRAGTSGSLADAVKLTATAFADLSEEQSHSFEKILNEPQQGLLAQLFDDLEKIHDQKFTDKT